MAAHFGSRVGEENRPLRRERCPQIGGLDSGSVSAGQRAPERNGDTGLRHRMDQGREVQLPGARAGTTGYAAGRNHRGHRALSACRHRRERTVAFDAKRPARFADPAVLLREPGLHQRRQERHRRSKIFTTCSARIIFPPRCHGKLGGKSAGLFLAKKIIEKHAPEAMHSRGR